MKRYCFLLFLIISTCFISHAQNKLITIGQYSIEMVPVEGGVFYMGAQNTDPNAPNYDPNATEAEAPVHKVQVSDFWISKYPVSQGFWWAVTGLTPHNDGCITESHCQDWYEPYIDAEKYPAYYVSYNDVKLFLSKLNDHAEIKQQISFGFREGFYAPTEAQWEYAARGGKASKNYLYAGSNNYQDVAWVAENTPNIIPQMGLLQPNELGLYDMCGGMAEWCRDAYAPYDQNKLYIHPDSILLNPDNQTGNTQVQRGGRFTRPAVHNRITTRYNADGDTRFDYYGFRLVMRAPIPRPTTSASSHIQAPMEITYHGNTIYLHRITPHSSVQVLSIEGKVLLSTEIKATEAELDMSELPAGMYILTCHNQHLKFMKY